MTIVSPITTTVPSTILDILSKKLQQNTPAKSITRPYKKKYKYFKQQFPFLTYNLCMDFGAFTNTSPYPQDEVFILLISPQSPTPYPISAKPLIPFSEEYK